MRTALGMVLVLGLVAAAPAAAGKPETMKGRISDSMCNGKHMAAEHDGKKVTDSECTAMCMKKGAKYVFVADDGKVYKLVNQHSKQIASHAGHQVELTGEFNGDTISAEKLKMIEAPKAK
jgi:hypothetical protein